MCRRLVVQSHRDLHTAQHTGKAESLENFLHCSNCSQLSNILQLAVPSILMLSVSDRKVCVMLNVFHTLLTTERSQVRLTHISLSLSLSLPRSRPPDRPCYTETPSTSHLITTTFKQSSPLKFILKTPNLSGENPLARSY